MKEIKIVSSKEVGGCMKKYKLVIKPAIKTTDRHKIEDLLKKMGYEVEGGGQMIDRTSCDITFEVTPQPKE